MKQKTATLAIASLGRSVRASPFRKKFFFLFFFPLLLLALGFITKRSVGQYRQEQANRELMLNVQEALRVEGKFQPDDRQGIFLNEPVSSLAQALPEPQTGAQERV